MIVVDRIEDGFAVVYSGDVRKDIPLSELPAGSSRGKHTEGSTRRLRA